MVIMQRKPMPYKKNKPASQCAARQSTASLYYSTGVIASLCEMGGAA